MSEPAGGVERYIRETDEYLNSLGHKTLTVEINSTSKFGNTIATEHIFIHSNKAKRLMGDVTSNKSVFDFLMNVHNRFQPDIIHIHHFRVSFMSVVKFINSVQTPCVYSAHDAQLLCPISTLILPDGTRCEGGIKPRCFFTGCRVGVNLPYEMYRVNVFNRFIKRRVAAFICPSKSMKNYMESFGYRPAVFVRSLPNYDLKSANKLELPNKKTIGFLGRIDRYKGLQYLVDALAMVKKTFPDIHLIISGEGDYSKQIVKQVKELGLSQNVELTGHIPKENHQAFFSSIQFLVVPSIMIENIVFTVQEAFSYGRTVIASEVGGIPEIVKGGVNGILVRSSNSYELAEQITNLLCDSQKLASLTENAMSTFKEMVNIKQSELDIIQVYNKVINGDPL